MNRSGAAFALLLISTSLSAGIAHSASNDVFYRGTIHSFTTPAGQNGSGSGPPSGGGLNQPTTPTPTALSLAVSGALANGGALAYGADWDTTIVASGGSGGYRLTTTGTIPQGISMVDDGSSIRLSGRVGNGPYGPFSIGVTDKDGKTTTVSIPQFSVSQPAVPFSIAAPATLKFPKNAAWSTSYSGVGGIEPYSIANGTISGNGAPERRIVSGIVGKDGAGVQATAPSIVVQVGEDARLTHSASLSGADVTKTGAVPVPLVIRNDGDFQTDAVPTLSVKSGNVKVAQGTCTARLNPGADCTAQVSGDAAANGPVSGSVSVSGSARTVQVDGTASGFASPLVASGMFQSEDNAALTEKWFGSDAKFVRCHQSGGNDFGQRLRELCGSKPLVVVVQAEGQEFGYVSTAGMPSNAPEQNWLETPGYYFSNVDIFKGKHLGLNGAEAGLSAKIGLYRATRLETDGYVYPLFTRNSSLLLFRNQGGFVQAKNLAGGTGDGQTFGNFVIRAYNKSN